MLAVLRLLFLLPVLVAVGALILWLITGQQRYRRFAMRLLTILLAVVLTVFLLMVIDRVIQLTSG